MIPNLEVTDMVCTQLYHVDLLHHILLTLIFYKTLGKKKKVEEDNMTIDLVDDENGENVGVPGAAMQDAEKNDQVPEDEFGAKDYRYISGKNIKHYVCTKQYSCKPEGGNFIRHQSIFT